jgi:proteic killer suppression protein
MIKSFKSKALKGFWEDDDASGIRPDWIDRVKLILDALHVAVEPQDMDLVGLRFHSLKGNRAKQYAVTVSRNWRITFRWSGQDATDVDLENYHGN